MPTGATWSKAKPGEKSSEVCPARQENKLGEVLTGIWRSIVYNESHMIEVQLCQSHSYMAQFCFLFLTRMTGSQRNQNDIRLIKINIAKKKRIETKFQNSKRGDF